MKVCQITGDMSAEKSRDNYPTDVFCDECYEEMNVEGEGNPILSTQDYDSSWADSCSNCGKSVDEEKEDQGS